MRRRTQYGHPGARTRSFTAEVNSCPSSQRQATRTPDPTERSCGSLKSAICAAKSGRASRSDSPLSARYLRRLIFAARAFSARRSSFRTSLSAARLTASSALRAACSLILCAFRSSTSFRRHTGQPVPFTRAAIFVRHSCPSPQRHRTRSLDPVPTVSGPNPLPGCHCSAKSGRASARLLRNATGMHTRHRAWPCVLAITRAVREVPHSRQRHSAYTPDFAVKVSAVYSSVATSSRAISGCVIAREGFRHRHVFPFLRSLGDASYLPPHRRHAHSRIWWEEGLTWSARRGLSGCTSAAISGSASASVTDGAAFRPIEMEQDRHPPCVDLARRNGGASHSAEQYWHRHLIFFAELRVTSRGESRLSGCHSQSRSGRCSAKLIFPGDAMFVLEHSPPQLREPYYPSRPGAWWERINAPGRCLEAFIRARNQYPT